MIKELEKVINGQNLAENEMTYCMNKIMSGEITDIQVASFLTALKAKGESINEIVAGAKVLRDKAEKVNLNRFFTVDTCGTGGDHKGTFNISTASAFVIAAAGVMVVKHGNRSITSKCGAFDVLEALGIKIDLTPEQVSACVEELGIGFFYAPTFHKAMKYVGNTRKELGFRTMFNILGPLANPASAKAQVLGVFDGDLTEQLAYVLKELGVIHALVVHGDDGLDEITTTAETKVSELKNGEVKTYKIKPEDFGFERTSIENIIGGDAVYNAEIIKRLLKGEEGAKQDILLLNAGAALYVAQITKNIEEGIILARKMINEGKAYAKLEETVAITNTY